MEERGASELRYKAFLSYSHKDAASAARLHRRLETYRMPKRLVGSATARGPVPERLWPIFRDRDELPAATDLSETVREALGRSGSLIVLCSPHSAASLWVAEEIETFRTRYPDRPILAAIIEGDPPDCFPAALRAFGQDGTWHEPLATDLRPEGDGPHLGLLKLVAGITGVGLDALVQRDAQRRIRRVTAVTGAALAALLFMTVLAWFALEARREAERQRAEAEGLIEFMLTDLRTRLRGVGRLDIMTAVNERALQYYESDERAAGLAADSLDRRARIFLSIGQDEASLGNLAGALAAYRQAHRITAELLARSPNDPARIFGHAQSDFYVAEVYRARRQWPAAERHYSAYAAAGDRLNRADPANPDYMMEAGWGALNLGIVQLDGHGDASAAADMFETAVRWFDQVAQRRPRDQAVRGELANAHAWLADAHLAREQVPQSLVARRRELTLRAQLHAADPRDMARLYALARAERSVARNSSILGDRAAAAPLSGTAYRRAQQLTRHDPRNQTWLLFKAKIECDWLLGEPGRPAALSADRLRVSIAGADAELARLGNTNRREISPCLPAAQTGRLGRQ